MSGFGQVLKHWNLRQASLVPKSLLQVKNEQACHVNQRVAGEEITSTSMPIARACLWVRAESLQEGAHWVGAAAVGLGLEGCVLTELPSPCLVCCICGTA